LVEPLRAAFAGFHHPKGATMTTPQTIERKGKIFLALMFASGFAALVYEVAFTKLLTYVFGVTAYAVSTVLASFMGGLALGSFLFGKIADGVRRPLRWYAILELSIAAYCVWTPFLYPLIGELYAVLYHRFGLTLATVTAIRYALCWLFIFVPTVLMGGTLPVAAKFFTRREEEIGAKVSRLYAINTIGAAAGTLAATYVLIFKFGLDGAVYLAAALNALIFVVAMALDRGEAQVVPAPQMQIEPRPAVAADPPQFRWAWMVMVGAFAGGAISLAYEVVWTHVLAQAIGNSVYAFGIMLFTFLLGIGLGSLALARLQPSAAQAATWVGATQIFVALTVVLLLPLWDKIPLVFQLGQPDPPWHALIVFLPAGLLLVARNFLPQTAEKTTSQTAKYARRGVQIALAACLLAVVAWRDRIADAQISEVVLFWAAEGVRFLCSVNVMIWPTVFLGATFPLLIRVYATGVGDLGQRIGVVYFLNTAGAIIGALAAGYWLIPWLGSQMSLKVLAVGNLLVGLLLFFALAAVRIRQKIAWGAPAVAVFAALLAVAPPWNLRVLNSGANVYFDKGRPIDEILYYAEDVHGGVISVVREGDTLTLLTNGKFEGNDGSEMGAQEKLAHIPMLYVRDFDRALVIGLGTGHTLATLAAYPFAEIDVAELAPHIVEASRQHFSHINGAVLDDPRVHIHVTDGRNWLQLTTNTYDAIMMEISSIWFAGAANLYNREFYEWCARRLRPDGILQQWVQLHHMRRRDLLVVFNTIHRVFPHVHFFLADHQGVLVASQAPLSANFAVIDARNRDKTFQKSLEHVKLRNLFTLFGGLLLDEAGMERALTNLAGTPKLSTDLRPHLEHATPMGNFLRHDAWTDNVRWLLQYRPREISRLVSVQDEYERLIFRGCIAFGRGDTAGAREQFQQAQRIRSTEEAAELLARLAESADGKTE
jgi:spermidine synthase